MRLGFFLRPAVFAGTLAALVGCRGCDKAVNAELVGAVGSVDKVDLTPYVAAAHAIVSHAPVPAAPAEAVPGHRVFVTAWASGKEPVTSTGLGASLFESVTLAATEAAKTASPDARVELTIVTGAVKSVVGPEMRERALEIGLHGYIGNAGNGSVGWVLPSDIIDHHRVTSQTVHVHKGEKPSEDKILEGAELAATMAKRAGIQADAVASMETYRFDLVDLLEPTTAGATPIRLYRTMPARIKTIEPEGLLRGVRLGAEYLTRMTEPDGRFTYKYDPVTDTSLHGYSMLRHAGTIYAMMCAYDEQHDPATLEAVKRAIGYMKAHFKPVKDGNYIIDGDGEEQQKVGGAGLALVAFSQYVTTTGDKTDLEPMRSLARFILQAQYADGHFRANDDLAKENPGGPKGKKETWYYPGEAILGLMRLYAIDPDPKWLAAARKGTDFLMNVRDVKRTIKDQIPDHWLSYALHDLFVVTKDPAYPAHAKKIAEEIVISVKKNDALPYEDFHGSFAEEAESTVAATRLEALASTMQLERATHGDPKHLMPTTLDVAAFSLSQQYDRDGAYFARVPAKVIGGVRESLTNEDVRIDYVQHAMCAWLRLARLMRDPTYGESDAENAPPAPAPTDAGTPKP